jgi:uncharacterized protein YsxB (DUF464 family)|nr:MAG TPA: YsxB-like protein [Caudoviricetes sp.]DAY68361.1 MAG TPA: YsxB-like protein [Caudoviricetes sp.]
MAIVNDCFLFSKRGTYMIKITVGISKEHIAVKCVGHANYNTCGQDIVCAGVSVLLQTLCYSLEEITKDKVTYSLKEGEGVVGVYHPTCKSLTLAKAFVIGCRDISNRYPDYVQLEIKN